MRLAASALCRLNAEALRELGTAAPAYDRTALPVSVFHIGPSAFFRAHQADYFDRLNAIDPRWGVHAVALRTRGTPDALAPQDGLYSLLTLDRESQVRVIGCLASVAHIDDGDALEPFASPDLRLVTLTVTEKGYCLDEAGHLDADHPDIRHDRETLDRPISAIGVLVHGLRMRRSAGLTPPIVLPCDNLPENGVKLREAVIDFANAMDPDLAEWVRSEVTFLSCMVDSITPATDDAVRDHVRQALGVDDAWPIQREVFTSWVIGRTSHPAMPALDKVGAVFTDDVEGHEQAKLRMLNGSHSTLAYVGLAHGYESVADAMADVELRALINDLMAEEIMPSLTPPSGLDLDAYRVALLERFANPAIKHRLSQIAWDGSQKLPIRLLATIADNLRAERSIDRLALGVAAWMRFIVRQTRRNADITDPMADALRETAGRAADDASSDTRAFLAMRAIFTEDLAANERATSAFAEAYAQMMRRETEMRGTRAV